MNTFNSTEEFHGFFRGRVDGLFDMIKEPSQSLDGVDDGKYLNILIRSLPIYFKDYGILWRADFLAESKIYDFISEVMYLLARVEGNFIRDVSWRPDDDGMSGRFYVMIIRIGHKNGSKSSESLLKQPLNGPPPTW